MMRSIIQKLLTTWVLLIGVFITIILGCTSLSLYKDNHSESYRIVQHLPNLPPFNMADAGNNSPLKEAPVLRLHKNMGTVEDKDRFFCSAFVVSDIYAITAAHCLNEDGVLDKGGILVHLMTGRDTGPVLVAKAVAINIVSDLGLIQGDFRAFNKTRVDPAPQGPFVAPGPFVTCGFPYGDNLLCTPFVPKGNYLNFIIGQGFLYPGMSGGPVIDTSSFAAIGVNSSMAPAGVCIAPIIGLFYGAGIKVEQ